MSDSVQYPELVIDLADEFLEKCRAGENPDVREYQEQYPDYSREIGELFPAMAMIEGISFNGSTNVDQPTNEAGLLGLGAFPLEFGDFRILREIGRGGMGVVYEAEQLSLQRRVALKLMAPRHTGNSDLAPRFTRESLVAAGLHHSNIVPVFSVGDQNGLRFYSMQFIDGWSLEHVIQQLSIGKAFQEKFTEHEGSTAGNLVATVDTARVPSREKHRSALTRRDINTRIAPQDCSSDSAPHASLSDQFSDSHIWRILQSSEHWKAIARVALQIAEAIDYAHRNDVIHRDVKPANLLVDRHGTVWLTDFGLAKADDQMDLTRTGDVLGTLRYMPPEALKGSFDERGDLYGIGLTLYELLTRGRAFEGTDKQQLIAEVSQGAIPPVRRDCPDIPRDLETIVNKATAQDRAERYQSAAQLVEDLRRFIIDEPITARRPSLPQRCYRWVRTNPWQASFVASISVTLLVGIVLGLAMYQTRHDRILTANQKLAGAIDESKRLLDSVEESPFDREALRAAQTSLERVKLLSDAPGIESELDEQTQQLHARANAVTDSIALFSELNDIQLTTDLVDLEHNVLSYQPALDQYQSILRRIGIMDTASSLVAVRNTKRYPHQVQEMILLAIDRIFAFEPEDGIRAELFEIAQAVEQDTFRKLLRKHYYERDYESLLTFAKSPNVFEQDSGTLGLLGLYLRRHPDRGAVIEFLKQAQRRHPDDFTINYRLVLMLSGGTIGEQREAIGYSTAALAIRPNNPGVQLTHANALIRIGRTEEGREFFVRLRETHPEYVFAQLELFRLSCQFGDRAETERARNELLTLEPMPAAVCSALGTYYYNQLDYEQAERFHRQAISRAPHSSGYRNNLAATLIAKGELDEGLAAATLATELNADDSYAWTNRGLALSSLAWRADESEKQRMLAEAESILRKSVALPSSRYFERRTLADFYEFADRFEEAIEVWNAWHEDNPRDPAGPIELARLFLGRGELESASSWISKAESLGAPRHEIDALSGEQLVREGKFEASITPLMHAFGRRRSVRLIRHLALAYHRSGQYGHSLQAHALLLELAPDNVNAMKRLAFASSTLGEFEQAILLHQRILKHHPNNAIAYYNIGNSFRGLNRLHESIDAYREAIRLDANYAESHTNLGQSLMLVGQFEEARREFELADELGQRRERWQYPTRRLIAQAERMSELAQELPDSTDNLDGLNARQLSEFAQLRLILGHHHAAATLFERLIEMETNSAVIGHNFYLAACACAMASLDVEDSHLEYAPMELRQLAIQFLRRDLHMRVKERESATPITLSWMYLKGWTNDPRLAAIRDQSHTTGHTFDEQAENARLWRDVDDEIKRLQSLDPLVVLERLF